MIALQLLGGFRAVHDDGRLIQVPERARALLAYLAMADSAVPRAVLASLLSSDECEQDQRRNLRQALYVARQAVGPDAIVCNGQGDLHLNEALLRADVCEFRRAIASGDEQSAVQAIALYQGSFLQGQAFRSSDFEDWLRSRRGELLDTVVRALVRVARLELDRGHFDHALAHTHRALELDPLCEEAHRQAIRCLAALGERSNALRHYEAARQLFRNELGVSLDARTDELRQTLASAAAQQVAEHRNSAAVAAAAATAGVIAITVTINEPANSQFTAGALSDCETRDLLDKWARWHHLRVGLGVVAAAAAALALNRGGVWAERSRG